MSTGHNSLSFSGGSYKGPGKFKKVTAHHHPGLEWVAPLAEVNKMTSTSHEGLLIGAADHYRLGDLLMPHVLTRLINFSRLRCAGLVTADLTQVGGHSVRNYGETLLEMKGARLNLVHFGGSDITLDLIEGYQAAADEDEGERFASLNMIGSRGEVQNYVRRRSGQLDDFAYLLAPEGEFYGAGLSFHAIGIPDPEAMSEERRARLLEVFRMAQFVGVRDENGANFLESNGIPIEKMPCGLSVLPQVCARQLREVRDRNSLEAIRNRFPNGWIAVEISDIRPADVERALEALREVSGRENLGLVFFEANKRPAENPSKTLRTWVESFPEWEAAAFSSDNIWEVASLLLHSRLYCGSCLSSRVICMSGGIARINFPAGSSAARSYCELWEHDAVPIEFDDAEDWSLALGEALEVDLSVLQQHSTWLHQRYQDSIARFCRETGMSPRLVPGMKETMHVRTSEMFHHLHDEWLSDTESTSLFRRLNRRFDRAPEIPKRASIGQEANR